MMIDEIKRRCLNISAISLKFQFCDFFGQTALSTSCERTKNHIWI
jgi:hypothetical protein